MIKTMKSKKEGVSWSVDKSSVVKPELSWPEWTLLEGVLTNMKKMPNWEEHQKTSGISEEGIKAFHKICLKIQRKAMAAVFGIAKPGTRIRE